MLNTLDLIDAGFRAYKFFRYNPSLQRSSTTPRNWTPSSTRGEPPATTEASLEPHAPLRH